MSEPIVYPHSRRLVQIIRQHLWDGLCDSPIRGAEVGVYKGETSAYLLRELPGLQLYLIDCWDPGPFKLSRNQFSAMAAQQNRPEVFRQWEREARLNTAWAGDRATIIKADFRQAASALVHNTLDFVFLDAAHSYQDTMDQILLYAPRVRSGGLVTGHDYGYPRPGYEAVAQAVDRIAGFLRVDLQVDRASYVWHWVVP